MTVTEKVAYLKGLMEGMKIDTESNEGKILAAMADILEVEDANGITWRYCGLTAPAVKAGDSVTTTATLGKAGAIPAETSGENHLHLECIKDGAYLDPEGLL